MNKETFEKLLDELDGTSLETLKTKNAKYSPEDDSLHNFHAGAEVMGGTAAQCAWGYATKHLVALRDKIIRNDWSDIDDVLEKIQDIINYLRFIWCIANENVEDKNNTSVTEDSCRCTYYTDECACGECTQFMEDVISDDGSASLTDTCLSCKFNFPTISDEYKCAPNNFKCVHNWDCTKCGVENDINK